MSATRRRRPDTPLLGLLAAGLVMATSPAAAGFINIVETGTYDEFTFSGSFSSENSGSGSFDLQTAKTPISGINRFGGDPSTLVGISFQHTASWTAETEVFSDENTSGIATAGFNPVGQFSIDAASSSGGGLLIASDFFVDSVFCSSGFGDPCSAISASKGTASGSEDIPGATFDELADLDVDNFLGSGEVANLFMAIAFFEDQDFFLQNYDFAEGLVNITLGPGDVTVTYHVVPLPTALPLFLTGLAAAGWAVRRRRGS